MRAILEILKVTYWKSGRCQFVWSALLVVASGFCSLYAQSPGVITPQAAPVPRNEARVQPAATAPTPMPAAEAANPPAPPVITSAAGDYVLSTSDTLEMSIFREPDLATRSKVASDGTVQLPLIGDVKVAGLTVREARELLRKRYNADYLVDPQVYLNVVDYAQRKFTILGEVARPGTYEFPGGSSLSLLQAVGIAGGFTRIADRGKVVVKRPVKGATDETIKVNAKKMAGDGKGTFEVAPGDVITVGESWL